MIGRTGTRISIAIAALGLFACGGGESGDTEEARNLNLPPADSLATDLNDQGEAGADDGATADEPETPPPPPPRRPATPPTLEAGTILELLAGDTLTSRHHEVGSVVRAFNQNSLVDSRGREVIPAEAVWVGTITAIAPSGGENDDGVLTIEFTEVEFGEQILEISGTLVSSDAFVKNRGFGAGDAAKVGAGAVVGGIAGRVLGGNTRGTVIGAIAGAAAGVGIMSATRPEDIILPAGYNVVIQLAEDIVASR